MAGVWAKDGNGRWRPLTATGFVSEADLHSLIEQTPAMLPVAGTPSLAIIGREVICGRERADLVAIEVDTGRPVIIEVKLAASTDRRQALTQVLGYAAYLRRLDPDGLNTALQPYLTKHGYASIAHAAKAAAQADPGFDDEAFRARFADSLADGRLRAVIVLDSAPPDIVALVGYLQEVTSDRLTLDLVVVTAYEVEGQRILVPQLVEPDRTQVTAQLAGAGQPSANTQIVAGADEFDASIESAPSDQQPKLRHGLPLERERRLPVPLPHRFRAGGAGRPRGPRCKGAQRNRSGQLHQDRPRRRTPGPTSRRLPRGPKQPTLTSWLSG